MKLLCLDPPHGGISREVHKIIGIQKEWHNTTQHSISSEQPRDQLSRGFLREVGWATCPRTYKPKKCETTQIPITVLEKEDQNTKASCVRVHTIPLGQNSPRVNHHALQRSLGPVRRPVQPCHTLRGALALWPHGYIRGITKKNRPKTEAPFGPHIIA